MPECNAAQLIIAPPSMSTLVISSSPSRRTMHCKVGPAVGGGSGELLYADAMFAQILLPLFFGEGTNDQHILMPSIHKP